MRSFVTGLLMFRSAEHETKVFSDVPGVTAWLPARHNLASGVHVSAADLEAALQHIRARVA